MNFSPDIIRLSAMLDDRDDNVAVNILMQLLAREDELGELPALLQESEDPLVRRRAHMLQNALSMRQRRRKINAMLNVPFQGTVFELLSELHLLWYDKDQPSDVRKDVDSFLALAAKFPMESLEDAEIFMRKNLFLPENETTIRPESYCIGTLLYQRAGATSVFMAMISELLGVKNFPVVRVLGQFAVMDPGKNQLLLGGGSWRLINNAGCVPEIWDMQKMFRYFGTTLLSCAVNSDSYRYIMSIAQALTGDESEHVFDDFPYPFLSCQASCGDINNKTK